MDHAALHQLKQEHQALTEALDRSRKSLKSLHAQRRFLKREYNLLQVRMDACTDSAEREAVQRQIADLEEALAIRLQVLKESYKPTLQLQRDLENLEHMMAASSQQQEAALGTARLLAKPRLLLRRLGTSLRRRQAFQE